MKIDQIIAGDGSDRFGKRIAPVGMPGVDQLAEGALGNGVGLDGCFAQPLDHPLALALQRHLGKGRLRDQLCEQRDRRIEFARAGQGSQGCAGPIVTGTGALAGADIGQSVGECGFIKTDHAPRQRAGGHRGQARLGRRIVAGTGIEIDADVEHRNRIGPYEIDPGTA